MEMAWGEMTTLRFPISDAQQANTLRNTL